MTKQKIYKERQSISFGDEWNEIELLALETGESKSYHVRKAVKEYLAKVKRERKKCA